MKKLFSSLLLTLYFLFVVFPHPALAINPFQYMRDIYSPAIYNDPNINLQKHIKETLSIIPWAMVDLVMNIITPQGTNLIAQCITDQWIISPTCTLEFIKSLMSSVPVKTPVANTSSSPGFQSQTLANLGYSFDLSQLVPQAHAQGYGYSVFVGGNIVGQLWTSVRNLAYLLSSLVLIIIGIMIMFRVKISPQVVVTVEQAVPKFAITLLLITFSFAIAGFMIDLVYLAEYLFAQLIGSAGIQTQSWLFQILIPVIKTLTGQNITLGVNSTVIWSLYTDMKLGNIFMLTLIAIVAIFLNLVNILGAFGSVLGVVGMFIGLIAILLFVIALLINIFRIYLAVLKAYAMMIIAIIVGPLQILFGAVPGGGGGFGSWLNNYLKNLLVFPLVSTCYILGIILILTVKVNCVSIVDLSGGATQCTGFSPTVIGGSADLAILFAGISIILAAHGIPKALDAFFAKKPFDLGSAIGESFSTPLGMTSSYAKAQYDTTPPGSTGWRTFWNLVQQMTAGSGRCLPATTLISTSLGNIPIIDIKRNALVWTVTNRGEKVLVPVAIKISRKVSKKHKVTALKLSDGRQLTSSPNHPLLNGNPIASLKPGDRYDGSTVLANTEIPYGQNRIYDILPQSDTGSYFANNIPLKSTIRPKTLLTKINLIKHGFLWKFS